MDSHAPLTEETDEDLLGRATAGDDAARDVLFSRHRHRLVGMVRARLHSRLHGRVDASDVIQEAMVDAARKFEEYARDPQAPFYVWLRTVAGFRLREIHRRHLDFQKRDARQEASVGQGHAPEADSFSLASLLVGSLTSPSQAAMRAEVTERVTQALDEMEAVDREILVLRHFEQMSTSESAQVLGISKSAAGARYLAALQRLRAALPFVPDLP